nr:ABC transporter substrate-binding protein [Acidimicrobiia bacterium]
APTAGPGQPAAPGATAAPTGGVGGCPDRAVQVPGDPYSPPCIAFAGDNGGATHRGVTAEEIVVSVRELEGPSAAEIFSDISGQNVSDSPQAYRNTVEAYAQYFSDHFQLYGRRIRVQFFDGQGVGASELLGGGREQALADAIQASQEIGAFADLTGITIPYADALARQGVVNFGSPYPSRNWFVERRPFSWSLFPDGTNVTEASVSWIVSRLRGQDTVQYAGAAYVGQPRRYAVVAPENPEYQESVNRYLELVGEAGFQIELNLKYKLDIATMVTQASGIIAQLKDAGITSVICACDPVMLALGMTPKANEQGYEPEWITSGLAFVDQDIVGQLIDENQWQRAFGIAYNAEPEPLTGSFPYFAYKSVRPRDEPAFGYQEIYYQFYLLVIGLQMAGPALTPDAFEQGMFNYPGGTGPRGTWGFGEGDYTPTDDFREIWWDPQRISPQNNQAGAWVQLDGGRRYFPGQVPVGPAPYFQR